MSSFDPNFVCTAIKDILPASKRKKFMKDWEDGVISTPLLKPGCHANLETHHGRYLDKLTPGRKQDHTMLFGWADHLGVTHCTVHDLPLQPDSGAWQCKARRENSAYDQQKVTDIWSMIPPTIIPASAKAVIEGDIKPEVAYLKPLNVIHPFYYKDLQRCPCCRAMDETTWFSWTATGHREVHGLQRKECAISYQLCCGHCEKTQG